MTYLPICFIFTRVPLGNLETWQNGNYTLIHQVKLYKDKRLQGFFYQGLLYQLFAEDFPQQRNINNQVWHLLQQEY